MKKDQDVRDGLKEMEQRRCVAMQFVRELITVVGLGVGLDMNLVE